MMRSPLEADRRLCRPAAELTGRHSSIKYSGAAPTRQCRTRRTILNSICFLIGSQCSSSRMAAEIPLNFAMFRTRRAAESRESSMATSKSFSSVASYICNKTPIHLSSAQLCQLSGNTSTIFSSRLTRAISHLPK